MNNSVSPGLRKREQIKRANRTMFLWIAGISVVVGVSAVLSIFLVQKILFSEKVISEKNKTVSTLKANLEVVDKLKENISVRNTSEALLSTRLNSDDSAIQSVLDALPATANSTALASSLQTKLLAGIPGVAIEKLSVDLVGGVETGPTEDAASVPGQINYTFEVSANANNYAALRQVLERIEKSIRPFNNTSVDVEVQNNSVTMTVRGVSYYESAKTVKTIDKVVK